MRQSLTWYWGLIAHNLLKSKNRPDCTEHQRKTKMKDIVQITMKIAAPRNISHCSETAALHTVEVNQMM